MRPLSELPVFGPVNVYEELNWANAGPNAIYEPAQDLTNRTRWLYNQVVAGLPDPANVQVYGAMGDGVTDDTAAIQAALAASSFIFFPAGTYMTDKIVPPAGAWFLGEDAATTSLKLRGADTSLIDLQNRGVRIDNLTLHGNELPTVAVVRVMPGAAACDVVRCQIIKAVIATSDLIAIPSTVFTTLIYGVNFKGCILQQNPADDTEFCANSIHHQSLYASVSVEDSFIGSAGNLVFINAGSVAGANFQMKRCKVGKCTLAVLQIAGITGSVLMEDVEETVTNGINVCLLYHLGGIATGTMPIEVSRCRYAVTGLVLVTDCCQPVYVHNNVFGLGDAYAAPNVNFGTRITRAVQNVFTTSGKKFIASVNGYLSDVDNMYIIP